MSTHDLMAHARVFGLATAAAIDSFSNISDHPLRVGQARQEARAIFTATGFDAAAVTATAIALSAPPALTTTRLQIRLTFDRPFGFIASPRDTDVVLIAGWVAQPEDYRQRELPAWVLADREERVRRG
jgi:serine protease inhibitor